MRIRKVTAHAFGPFNDLSIELAPCMTVIAGPNESGKSTWHAAIYAALCGRRRGPGKRAEDTEFEQKHQPWDRDTWEVSCLVDLPDGRTIELRHDLAGRVDCTARETHLGTDVAHEIVFDGAPDGSRWLGLERRAFRAVASIRQAQILEVTEQAGTLQQYLQRAAATAGADETAASALGAIENYSREHVGLLRANSTKPHMTAIRARDVAQSDYETAKLAHEDWLRKEEEVGQLESKANEASAHARAAEALHAQQIAARLSVRFEEAQDLAARHPTPPSDLTEDATLTEQITEALRDWENRPNPTPLSGTSAQELERRLGSLPEQPEGDLEPVEAVVQANRVFVEAHSRFQLHKQQQPYEPAGVRVQGVSESELIDIARELETPVPQVDPHLREEMERHRQEGATVNRGRSVGVALGVAAGASILAGVGLLAADLPGGVVGLGIGALLALGSIILLWSRRPTNARDSGLRAAEARLLMAEQLVDTGRERRENAISRAQALGIEPDPGPIRQLADEVRKAERAREDLTFWERQAGVLSQAVDAARVQLAGALRQRGVDVGDGVAVNDLAVAVTRYEDDCRRRREQSRAAAERAGLEQALEARVRAEARLATDVTQLEQAQTSLRTAALAAGVMTSESQPSLTDDELVDNLRSWRAERVTMLEQADAERKEWARLQALLEGQTIEELERHHNSTQQMADELSSIADEKIMGTVFLDDEPDRQIRELTQRANELEQKVAAARREQQVLGEQILSVPESEERLAEAEDALRRVEDLANVLDTTKRFLEAAQDRIHRNVAPLLAGKVEGRLARVTGGRYGEVTVDPETLNVRVRDASGRWRDADHLSHGTAEQIYLLLRVAMAEILTPGEIDCPLLLDDTTVQSDPQRTRAILDVLHEVSTDHQVILFSQEEVVTAWARDHLEEGSTDRLLFLETV